VAVQFGYSDSGRFIGQMAATFRIEHLRLRIAHLLHSQGMGALEVILFNTHGESIGRGGHPLTLADRIRYVAPPVNRAEFERRGIMVREELSFQGGDGYLAFFTPAGALAAMRQIVSFALGAEPEAAGDPVYAAPDYAAEFFAIVQQEFGSLVEDPDYAALLGLFATNLLYKTGSRAEAPETEGWARPMALAHPSQVRAIPNNAILQSITRHCSIRSCACTTWPARSVRRSRTSSTRSADRQRHARVREESGLDHLGLQAYGGRQ